MIRINLLPAEYRRADRTSPKVFAAMIVTVVLTCSVFGWFGLIYFGELRELERRHETVANTLATESKRAAYYDQLVKEEREFSKRSDTIQTIAGSRLLWTKILEEVIDVVNNNTDRHVAWFTDLDIKEGSSAKAGPQVHMPGMVQGARMTALANFHEDLERSEFWKDVQEVSAPNAAQQINKARYPPEAYAFNLKWSFKQAKLWEKNQLARKRNK